MLISDYTEIRERFENKNQPLDIIEMIEGVIDFFKNEKQEQFTCFALDSLNALYSLIDVEDLRIRLFQFFKGFKFRNNNVSMRI